jgi:hypothetical protein
MVLANKARKDATPRALEIDGDDPLLDIGLLEDEKLRAFNAAPHPTLRSSGAAGYPSMTIMSPGR